MSWWKRECWRDRPPTDGRGSGPAAAATGAVARGGGGTGAGGGRRGSGADRLGRLVVAAGGGPGGEQHGSRRGIRPVGDRRRRRPTGRPGGTELHPARHCHPNIVVCRGRRLASRDRRGYYPDPANLAAGIERPCALLDLVGRDVPASGLGCLRTRLSDRPVPTRSCLRAPPWGGAHPAGAPRRDGCGSGRRRFRRPLRPHRGVRDLHGHRGFAPAGACCWAWLQRHAGTRHADAWWHPQCRSVVRHRYPVIVSPT